MSALAPLSLLTFETPLAPSREIGKRGQLKWIALDKLFIDESYQRPVMGPGRKNIRRIVEGFHFSLFSPLVVSPRPGGIFAVIDGQHRATAAMHHGNVKELPCLVLECTPADEARAFHTINGTVTRVHPQHLFRARITAGDPSAVAANDAALAAGVEILNYPVAANLMKPGQTLAGRTIELCLVRYGRSIAIKAMELVTKTGDGNAGLVREDIVEGGCLVLLRNPKWFASPGLVDTVAAVGVREMYSTALKRNADGQGTVKTLYAEEMANACRQALGDGGGTQAPVKTLVEAQREAARREQAVIRASAVRAKQPAKKAASEDDKEAIAKFIATKGVRTFESGATGNTSDLLDWLVRLGHKARRLGGTSGGKRGRIYEVDGKRRDLKELIDIVNRARKRKGLEPISRKEAA